MRVSRSAPTLVTFHFLAVTIHLGMWPAARGGLEGTELAFGSQKLLYREVVLLEVCLTLVLAVHLMCVNVATAGPLVCIWLEWKEAGQDSLAGRLGRFLAWASLALLVAGAGLGLVLGLLLWDDGYRGVLARFPSRIHYGVWELLFSLVLMLLHALWWGWVPRPSAVHRFGRSLLPLLSGTNLMYHFPYLFVILSDVAAGLVKPESTFRQLIVDGSVTARVVHFGMAAFAMTGTTMIGWTLWRRRSPLDPVDQSRAAIWGARIALVPTLLQIPIGVWVLSQLPAVPQQRLLGGDVIATGLFTLSVLAAVWLMHQLSAVALGETRRPVLVKIVAAMVIVIFLMTGVLQRLN